MIAYAKSTLLRVLNRLYDMYPEQRATGEVLLDGQNILGPDVDLNLLRSRIGMVFQVPTPFPMSIFEETAFRNGTLQGAYLNVALRALGLDVGSMSGFDRKRVDAEFFPDGQFRSNWLMNVGVADPSTLFPRGPRLAFGDVAQVL